MCLQKILGIIWSVPPPFQDKPSFHHHNLLRLDSSSSSSSQDKTDHSFERRAFLINLNLELTSSPKTETSPLAIDHDDPSSQEKKGNPVEDDQKRETEPSCSREEEAEEGASSALLVETGEELSSENGELERDGLSSGLGTREIDNDKESVKKGRVGFVRTFRRRGLGSG